MRPAGTIVTEEAKGRDSLTPNEVENVLQAVRRSEANIDLEARRKGAAYMREGRVMLGSIAASPFSARVRGTKTYTVVIHLRSGKCVGTCTCPAFDAWLECKHLAAALIALIVELGGTVPVMPLESLALKNKTEARVDAADAQIGADLRNVLARYKQHSAAAFAEHFALFAGAPLKPAPSSYQLVGDWISDLALKKKPERAALEALLLKHVAEFERAAVTLARWRPEVQGTPSGLLPLVMDLADLYLSAADRTHALPPMPVPDDARFSGWSFLLDAGSDWLTVRPKPPLEHLGQIRIDIQHARKNAIDARSSRSLGVELSALRALVLELVNTESELSHKALARFTMAPWEKLLGAIEAKSAFDGDLGFFVADIHGRLVMSVLRRSSHTGTKRTGKWRKGEIVSILATGEGNALEREIATLAKLASQGGKGLGRLHGPEGFLLVSKLAEHPRIFADTNGDVPLKIVAEDVRLDFERTSGADLSARFLVGNHALSFEDLRTLSQETYLFVSGNAWLSAARLPKELAQWVQIALKTESDTLSFPSAALPRLRQALVPLRDAGYLTKGLTEDLMGTQVPYAPRVALSVEWGASTKVTLLIEVSPEAPLISAGEGTDTFAFSRGNEAVWVHRDKAREKALLAPLQESLQPWIGFDDSAIGATLGLPETLALLAFIEECAGTIRVESRTGRAPKVLGWSDLASQVSVTQRGAWFSIQGGATFGEQTLPFGDLLAAIRTSQQFVSLGSDHHLEITEEIRNQLGPLAFAASEGEKNETLLHQGFGKVLLEVRSLLHDVATVDAVDWSALEERLKSAKRGVVPKVETGELRDYQEAGVRWMTDLSAWAPGCVLADDMGLGKTVQTAALLLGRKNLGPALVVAPASVAFNWKIELERFAPSLRVCVWNEERHVSLADLGKSDVAIVSYGLVQRTPKDFARLWATLVLDEAQFLKNHLAKRAGAIRDLSRDFTVALSGTPLENHLGELWSVMSLVFPGLLGSEPAFRRRFRSATPGDEALGGGGAGSKAVLALNGLLAPFLLRRTRREVLRELPERQDVDIFVDLTEPEAKHYEALRRACELQFTQKDARLTLAQHKIQMLAALTRLRQIACDASLVDPAFVGDSAKLVRLQELCTELREQGAQVLVFSQFTKLLKKARACIERTGASTLYLDGETPLPERKRVVEAFQGGEADVFCISLKAGGTGLNLTRASYVIHLDPWWNPAVEEQANSRAHRMGQKQAVTAYRLIARGTIEEAILGLHARKKELALSVLEGKGSTTALGTDEFLALVRSQQQAS
jgi:superfamily II DNA or RNA helicase